jgi:hypothetical protein
LRLSEPSDAHGFDGLSLKNQVARMKLEADKLSAPASSQQCAGFSKKKL